MTPEDVVKRHQEVKRARLALEAEQKLPAEEGKPPTICDLKDAEETLELWLLDYLNAAGATNIKTDYGTAYKSTETYVTMKDRQALLAHVKETGNFDFFTNHLTKETCKAYLETNKKAPPGVEITTATVVNVRKS